LELFHNVPSSDDDSTDLSSPSSCGTPTDGLDSFIFDIPEIVLPLPSPTGLLDSSNEQKQNDKSTPNNDEISFNQTLRKHSIPDQMKDEKYWKRRVRNNRSAKKSREAKRAKDDVIKSRMAFLEMENSNLKMLVSKLLAERNAYHQDRHANLGCYN